MAISAEDTKAASKMKLKFKMQKALVQQQQQQHEQLSQALREENDDNNLEPSALHGLAAVAVAVEADQKGLLFENRKDLNMKQALDYGSGTLDVSKIKLEREEGGSPTRQESSATRNTTDANSPNSIKHGRFSDSLLVNNNPEASAPSVCESKTDHLPLQIAVDHCNRSDEPERLVGGDPSRTCSPLSAGVDAATITAVGVNGQSHNHQQQVRVIKDGRYYEDGHASHSPVAAAAALLALNGKQDVRITQISNSQSCRGGGGNPSPNGKPSSNLVNVITLGNGALALDSVKLKLGENDTQIFRAPMVSSTTSQLNGGGGVPASESASGGVVVTVESSMSSMRPPAPRVHLQPLHGHGNGGVVSMKKQSPSSTTHHNHHQHHMGNGSASSSSLSPAAEEPSSSIPDLGEFQCQGGL